MRDLFRRTAVVGLLALGGAGLLAASAAGANPHFVSASATVAAPNVTAPANLTWDASLVVHFKVAGLGHNHGLTASLAASGTGFAQAACGVTAGRASASVSLGPDFAMNETDPCSVPDYLADQVERSGSATLSSDKNGNVTGTMTLPAEIDVSTPPGSMACAYVDWTGITLTVGSISVNLPDVTGKYDNSGGSLCAFPI